MLSTISIAAAAALAAGGFGLANAWRRQQAGAAIVASAVITVPLVELAGVLGAGSATRSGQTWLLALVAGALVVLPLALPVWSPCRTAIRGWRTWSVAGIGFGAAVAVALVTTGARIPPPDTQPIALGLASAIVFLSVGWRQLHLHRLGGRPGPLVTAIGLGLLASVGTLGALWGAADRWSVVLGLGALAGSAVAAAGVGAAQDQDHSVVTRLAPLVQRAPLLGLELQVTPIVQRYVAALDRKDPLTRDHGLRVGELALRVGRRAGLSPDRLEALGLAALLHDVGKLFTADEILRSSTTLTAAEFDAVRQHPVWGAELLASSPVLAPAADLVRWHHERMDGTGYPDGLRGAEIPLEAAIISACDAWDAMTFSLRYRSAMSPERARWILLGGSGTQWSPRAVDLLFEELATHGPVDHAVYDAVPRPPDAEDVDDDAIPDEAKRQLT
jgi:hypothetical protein